MMHVLLLVLFLAPLIVMAQPGESGGSVSFRLRTRGGSIVNFGRHDVKIAARWDTVWLNGIRARAKQGSFEHYEELLRDNLVTNGYRISYSAIPTPSGGNVPKDFHFEILFGADTMLLYFEDFHDADVDLGTLPLSRGVYRLPDWYPFVAAFQLDGSRQISPLDLQRFAVDSIESLPRIVVRKIADRDRGEARHRSEAEFNNRVRFRLQTDREWGVRDWQLFRTLDGGESWQSLLGGPPSLGGMRAEWVDIVCGGGTVLLWISRTGSSSNRPLVLRSDDTGTTWTVFEIEEVLPGLPGNERTYPFVVYDIAYNGRRFIAAGERRFGYLGSQRSLPGLYELWFSPDRKSEPYSQLVEQSSREVRQWMDDWNASRR